MPEQTYVPCPHCGHPYPMTLMQKDLYRGRTLACNNCAKTFSADELTPTLMESPKVGSPAAAGVAPATPWPPGAARPSPRPSGKSTGGKMIAVWTIGGALAVVALLLAMLIPPLNRAREQSRRVTCANNMRQLGQAMMIYASVNGGRFPDRLDRLLAYVSSSAMVCPSTGHTPAPGATPQIQAANMARGGHVSYVYVGDAYSTGSQLNPATTVVLYESLSDHGDGIHALYADGHTAYLPAAMATAQFPGLATAAPSIPAATPATTPATAPATTESVTPAG